MAALDIDFSGAAQPPKTKGRKNDAIDIRVKIPRRKITLIAITFLLNVLHWGSLLCLFASIYQMASTPDDKTSIPAEILTLTTVSCAVRPIPSMRSYVYRHL
jgi:hypothetical protein